VDRFKSLQWSMNRRVALEGIKLWKVVGPDGRVSTDVGNQFLSLCEHSKFVDIAVMLVKSRSIDENMEIVLGGGTWTPLLAASQQGHVPVVQSLLEAGADVDKARDDGWTALIIASKKGHVPVVQALLQAGADVDKAEDGCFTPLLIASMQGHLAIVRLLEGQDEEDDPNDVGGVD
jgi:hypothetical protein